MTAGVTFHDNSSRRISAQSVAYIVATAAACILAVLFVCSYFTDIDGDCNIAAEDAINPNTASMASIARLPGIGDKLAGAILEYRRTASEGNIAFETAQDLQKVRGIGPKKLEDIRQYLCFE